MRTNLLFTGMLSALFFVLTPFSALAQVTSTQTLNSPPPGIFLFGGYAQDFVSKFWSAFSSDVAPYASQLSSWASPLPQTPWNAYNNPAQFNFLYDGGTPGNPRTALSQSTLGRVCYLVDPTSVPTNVSYSGSWEGTAGAAEGNRVFVYTPTTITSVGSGTIPAGWNDRAQNHTGCPPNDSSDYYCHYGVSSFACTTYAPPAQTLSLDKTTITAGQSATLSWNDTLARDYFAPYGAEPDPAQVAGARPRNGVIELGETNDGVSPNSVCTSTNWSNKVSAGGYWQESSYFVCLQGTPGHCTEPDYRTKATWITDSASPATAESKSGSVTVSPTTTTTYKYSCTNANGTRTVSATVNVASAPPPPPSASCAATTIGHCSLPAASSGNSAGSCVSGYTGSCNYSCTNGTWTKNTNTCTSAVPAPTVTATVNGASSASITTAQSFDLKMTSTNAAFCTWSRTGSYSGNWTNLPVPAPNTSYDSGALSWGAGNATWTFTCANSTGLKSSSASVTITNAPVNGVCAATHYNCSAGVSTSNSSNPTNYTWTCAGSNGGTNASCSETKALPDLVPYDAANAVSPAVPMSGQPITFTAGATNAGSANAVNFPNIIQVNNSTPSGTLAANIAMVAAGYPPPATTLALLVPGGTSIFQGTLSGGLPAGTYWYRGCANFNTSWSGSIPESNTANNCGVWKQFTVQDICYGLGCTTGSAGTGPGGPGGSGSTCYYGWNGQPKTNVPSQCCSLTPGVCPLAPTVSCSANPSEVDKGQSTFIQWNSSGADSCTATGFTINGNGKSGNQKVTPQDTPVTNYQISCTGPGGSGSCFVSVPVHTPQAGISSSPARVQSGGSITLTWKGTDVTFCTVSGGTGASAVNVSGPADRYRIFTTGSGAVRPITTQTTYTISCNGGAASSAVTTNILPGFREF